MSIQRTVPSSVTELISKLYALYPGDIDTVAEKLLDVMRYCITRKLFDAETLATLRADAEKWPESVRELLAADGGSR